MSPLSDTTSIKVLHLGGFTTLDSVGGISYSVQRLAEAQRELGHDARLFMARPSFSRSETEPLIVTPSRRHRTWLANWREAIRSFEPDVLHVHSAFQPRVAALLLSQRPSARVVLHPRGALASESLQLGRAKKTLYLRSVERPLYSQADRVIALTAGDARDIVAATGVSTAKVSVVPNAADRRLLAAPGWTGGSDSLIFLGRFDVRHKGIDRYVDLARAAPDISIALYGQPGQRRARELQAVLRSAPANLSVRDPIFADAKQAILRSCRGYLHLARWEAFGNAIVEAMTLGAPLVLAAGQYLADDLRGTPGILVVDPRLSPSQQARRIREHTERFTPELSELLRAQAARRYHPQVVAQATLEAYLA